MKAFLIALLFVEAALLPQFASADARWRKVTDYVDRLQATTVNGLCIAIATVNGTRVTQHFAGTCNTRSLFQIGSITKTFTATLLADAVISEKVSLQTTLVELLNHHSPSYRGRSITLLDLATHASGLPRLPDNLMLDAEHMTDPYRLYGEAELLSFLASHELRRAPGEELEYSNLGMGLLGYLLSKLYHRPYSQLVAELITEPLGMSNTVIIPNQQQRGRVMTAHNEGLEEVPNWQFDVLAGAGALYSTLDDLVTYLKANLDAPAGPIGDRVM